MNHGGVSLSDVAEALRVSGLLTAMHEMDARDVTGVSQDSRAIDPGDLFLAWSGTKHDSHRFVRDAVEAGAVAAVVEEPLEGLDVPQLQVSDGRTGGAVAAGRVFGDPWRELHVVGVTGTNGKTTTTLLARHLLGRGRETRRAAAIGTLGMVEADGAVRQGSEGLTTPGPVRIASWLRELANERVDAVVLEASSHALDQRRLDAVRFQAAVFTNLSRDHLDYHPSWQAYFDAKARLLGLVSSGGAAIVNGDVPAWERLPVGGLRKITYRARPRAGASRGTAANSPPGADFGSGSESGPRKDSQLLATDVELMPTGSRFRMEMDGEAVPVELPLLGAFNVENALAAAGVALAAGETLEAVAEGLGTVPQIPGRLEVVMREPFSVLIDFAHTPDALGRVVESLRELAPGRFTVVFGAGGDRDRKKRPLMGRAVAGKADRIIVTSDNPRTEDPDGIIDEIVAGMEAAPHTRIVDRTEAVRHAFEGAEPGEVILLAGKGHETYQEVGTEKRPYDERILLRDWLRDSGRDFDLPPGSAPGPGRA